MAAIEGDVIKFKSYPEHFISEQSGIKKYIARNIENLYCDGIELSDIQKCKYIEILNCETGKTFRRRLKTCLPVGNKHLVFSW